jgi:hypothetical protein
MLHVSVETFCKYLFAEPTNKKENTGDLYLLELLNTLLIVAEMARFHSEKSH